MAKKSKAEVIKKVAWWIVGVLTIVVAIGGYFLYNEILKPNVTFTDWKRPHFIYIPTGSTFDDVENIFISQNYLLDTSSFRWTAKEMKYINKIKPGRYLIKPRMNNKMLISLLRSGKQTPVNLVFNNIRTKEQLAQKISEQIEAPAASILNLLGDEDYSRSLGFTVASNLSLFIPNTYQVYWNTSADQFIKRMKKEYDKFWTAERKRKAKEIGFTPTQVSALASIVQQETNKTDEKSIVAGVYINRFKKGWKLEADPTLVYIHGDFTVNRVLNVYKEIDSPYNTYKYAGIPPGPICLPTVGSINAVLNYTKHSYMYFCAKEDLSGAHSFAVTYSQHLMNARRFQRALDRRGIRS